MLCYQVSVGLPPQDILDKLDLFVQQMKKQSQQMKEQSQEIKEQSQEMKEQSQQLRQEELRIVEERCARAEEKHWEAQLMQFTSRRKQWKIKWTQGHQVSHKWRKPAEFDGKVPWEAYQAQFELLADVNGWSDGERALQLVTCLRGQTVEVLSHLAPAQRASYRYVVEALQCHFGDLQQAEVHRSCLKVRVRCRGELLTQLAQKAESLVH
ncbi:hypothetical protein E2C01_032920 [Portunus trituberculatus]|uniref:Uncharacterized protein n=1 Tax=Portunus trituberculatus TaxID=210409 RepID=A0A5B7F115_PORTR|nr:hypothetical protein [Portunus trituberculatus]